MGPRFVASSDRRVHISSSMGPYFSQYALLRVIASSRRRANSSSSATG